MLGGGSGHFLGHSVEAHAKVSRQSKAPNCDDRHLVLPMTGNIYRPREINSSNGNLLSMEGSMIDAVMNVAVFAALVLCIVGFSTWAHKRVDDGCR
jgi:hypothetical protein